MSKQYYAFYSRSAEAHSGSIAYEGPNGEEVICTAVHDAPEYPGYGWKDAVALGPVGRFLRTVTPSSLEDISPC